MTFIMCKSEIDVEIVYMCDYFRTFTFLKPFHVYTIAT